MSPPSSLPPAEETVVLAAPPPPSETARRFGHYEILLRADGGWWELGQGSMGVTYKAFDTTLRCPVALKVISARISARADARERFLREARAAAQLRHPNVAGVFHFGTRPEDGQCFYAMELVEGEPLDLRVRRGGPLSPALALDIGAQVARALIAAERRGLIHRDIKPANLMLVADETQTSGSSRCGDARTASGSGGGDGPQVKVIDFGLAKAVSAADTTDAGSLTQDGFLGTPNYASPEQFARGDVDGRSDVFSLGVTLWFLLTAQTPFAVGSGDPAGIAERQLRHRLPTRQLAELGVPACVVALLESMLETAPARRPSPQALHEAIQECRATLRAADSPADFPAPEPKRRQTFWRRKAVVAGATVAIAALAGAAFLGRHFFPATGPVSPPRAALPAPAQPEEKSIAVLPFDNLSDGKENAFFADGIQDDILIDLAKIADLKVISRTSVMQYKAGTPRNLREIARALGVAHVVEGSVRREGNRVRVSAQLIDARTDTHVWAEQYDRELADVFAIQSEVAHGIVAQLRVKLSPGEKAALEERPTRDLLAYELFVRARQLVEQDYYVDNAGWEAAMRQAAPLLDEAVTRDPNFVRAWCTLAEVHGRMYFVNLDRTPARLLAAEKALAAAQRLRPESGEVHLASGLHAYRCYRDFERARAELEIAARSLPNNAQIFLFRGLIDRRQGRWTEATGNMQRGAALDPRNTWLLIQLFINHHVLRRPADAARTLDLALAASPQSHVFRIWRALLDVETRGDLGPLRAGLAALPADYDPDGQITRYRVTLALFERDADAAERALRGSAREAFYEINGVGYPRAWFEALIARVRGDLPGEKMALEAARDLLEKRLRERPDDAKTLSLLGVVEAGLGRKEEALRAGRRATELLPVEKDALDGPLLLANLALIHAWNGDKAAALAQLAALGRDGSPVAAQFEPMRPSFGDLRLHPCWASLRDDPGFEQLVAELAPR